ncbi:hypothetical protein [Pontixanthobacter sp. CEM42]|nr:hypothetical protein [Pontixanthobacter sp. CEM42]
MTRFYRNSAAAMASLLIVAMTFAPLLSVPPAQAASVLTMPVLI